MPDDSLNRGCSTGERNGTAQPSYLRFKTFELTLYNLSTSCQGQGDADLDVEKVEVFVMLPEVLEANV